MHLIYLMTNIAMSQTTNHGLSSCHQHRDGRWLGTKEIKNPNNAIGLSGQSTINEHKYRTQEEGTTNSRYLYIHMSIAGECQNRPVHT